MQRKTKLATPGGSATIIVRRKRRVENFRKKKTRRTRNLLQAGDKNEFLPKIFSLVVKAQLGEKRGRKSVGRRRLENGERKDKF